ncbi:MAG: hypothetical protein ACFE9S_17700 [Candidatus Hermodarchaeota archaeon]
MFDKLGIIIKTEKVPKISSRELKSILSSLDTNSIDTIICESILEAKKILEEEYKEIAFIYLTAPIPTIEQPTYKFIEYITKNENYKHIKFFVRMPKRKQERKYKWDDDFINFITL